MDNIKHGRSMLLLAICENIEQGSVMGTIYFIIFICSPYGLCGVMVIT